MKWTGPSYHDIISAKAQGGNTGTFSISFRMVLRSSPPIFSFILIFSQTSPQMSQCDWTSDRTCQLGGSQSASMRQTVQESQSAPTISLSLNRGENKRSSFAAFGASTRAGFNVKTDEPPRARSTELAGRIWPAGRTLQTPALLKLQQLSYCRWLSILSAENWIFF